MSQIQIPTTSSFSSPQALPRHTDFGIKIFPNLYHLEVIPQSGGTLVVAPRCEVDFEQFCAFTPPRSIAGDGIVKGPTQEQIPTAHFSLNHHDGVNRDVTLCTTQQADKYLLMGLRRLLLVDGVPCYQVYLNDPDPDSSFASAILLYPEVSAPSPIKNRLLELVAQLDVSAGVRGPAIDSQLMREGAWIFEPYYRSIKNLYDMNGYEVTQVVLDQHERIKKFLLGRGNTAKVETESKVYHQGSGWALIQEVGPFARLKAFQDSSLEGLVVLKSESEAGYRYSAVRGSRFSSFPLLLLTDVLNRTEGLLQSGAQEELKRSLSTSDTTLWRMISECPLPDILPWGGGEGVIGCLRQVGSQISPVLMAPLMNRFMQDLAVTGYRFSIPDLKRFPLQDTSH